MNNSANLVKLIAEKNLLQPGIVIRSKVKKDAFGGIHLVSEQDSILLSVNQNTVISRVNGRSYTVKFEDISAIDGMNIERFAQAYRIKTKKR